MDSQDPRPPQPIGAPLRQEPAIPALNPDPNATTNATFNATPNPGATRNAEPPEGIARPVASMLRGAGRAYHGRGLKFRGFGGTDAQIVPSGWLSGPMPWVIAIMVALTVIATATGLALHHMMAAASGDLAGGVTVQVLEAEPIARDRQSAAVMAVLREAPGVTEARQVPQEELDAMIAPWLGGDAGQGHEGEAVPVPAVIDAQLDGEVNPGRLEALRAALHHVAPGAEVDAQASWLGPVFDAMQSLKILAFAMIALLAAAMSACVLLATRTALGTHRATIEIVHHLGGTDRQIARVFQRAIGIDTGVGALAGVGAALVVIWFLGRRFARLGAGLVEGGALGWGDWLVLGAVPLLAIGLAVVTARVSVLRWLARML